MRPVVFGLCAVSVLFLAVCIYTMVTHESAMGLMAVFALAIEPVWLALYVAGFGVTYWLTRR